MIAGDAIREINAEWLLRLQHAADTGDEAAKKVLKVLCDVQQASDRFQAAIRDDEQACAAAALRTIGEGYCTLADQLEALEP